MATPKTSVKHAEAQRLSTTGIGQFELTEASLQAVGSLQAIFAELDMNEVFDLPHNALLTVNRPAGETAHRLVVTHSQSTGSMRWLWAVDSHTLDLFGEVITPDFQRHFSHVAGSAVEVNAACYVVVRNGVTDRECVPHYDFFSSSIPRAAAFSLMTPMSAAHPPRGVGGLEFWPWTSTTCADTHRDSETAFRCDTTTLPLAVARYHYGSATVIDGRLLHRTQPYAVEEDSAGRRSTSCTPGAVAAGELRVLLCVNASTTTLESWPHLERLLRKQVGLGLVRCNQVFQTKHIDEAPRQKKAGAFLLRKLMR